MRSFASYGPNGSKNFGSKLFSVAQESGLEEQWRSRWPRSASGLRFLHSWFPSPLKQSVVGLGLLLLGLIISPIVNAWFEHPPIEIVGVPRTEITADGRWRMTRTIRINETCGSLVWDRSFKDSGKDDPRRTPAAAASEGMGLDPIQASRPVTTRRPPGDYTSWYEYDVIPGKVGSYVVTLSPGWCPSGWTRTYNIYSVPYDWTNLSASK